MKCFYYAARGIWRAYRRERNLRIHSAAAFFVVFWGIICGISAAQWAACLLCIGAVISAELLNTSLEALCDEVTREWRPGIALCKDCAAGAVLVLAITSVAVGLLVFLSPGVMERGLDRMAGYPALWFIPAAGAAFFVKIIFFTWRKNNDR